MQNAQRLMLRTLLGAVALYVVSWHLAFVIGVAVPTLRVGYPLGSLGSAYLAYLHYLWTPAHSEVPREVQRLGLLIFAVAVVGVGAGWAIVAARRTGSANHS